MAAAISVSAVGCKNEPDTDTSAPDEVGGLEIKAADGNAVLTWTNPGDSDFDGIRISLNPAEGTLENAVILEKTAKSFSVSGLETGKTYTFTIQTFDTNRNYSEGTTKEVSVENTKDTVPPGKVQELKAEAQDGGARITWKDPSDEDLFEVEISYSAADESQEKAKRASIVPKGAECAYISGLRNSTEYTFTATAIDLSGNRSESQNIKTTPETSETGNPMIFTVEKSKVSQNADKIQQMTITVNIKSESGIKKVRYVKAGGSLGEYDVLRLENSYILDDANMYYDEWVWDTESETEKFTGKKIQQIWDLKKDVYDPYKYTFTITADPSKYENTDESERKRSAERDANKTYRIVALDEMGRYENHTITVDDFDYNPPTVNTVVFKYDNNNKKISVTVGYDEYEGYEYEGEFISFSNYTGMKNATIRYCKKGTDTVIKTETFTPAPDTPREIRNAVFTTDTLEENSQYVFTITATDILENKHTVTFERSAKKYELGDSILKDGSTRSVWNGDGTIKDDINKLNSINKENIADVIAYVVFINESGEAFGIAEYPDPYSKALRGIGSNYIGKNAITSIQCTPDKTSVSLSDESTDIKFTGDIDGSDNWSEICKADTTAEENAETNYPAFYCANNLATSDSNYENFPSGWYIPTIAEWHKIFLNSSKTGIKVYSAWTSNQTTATKTYSWTDDYGAWTVRIAEDSISFEEKEMYLSNPLYLIRKFTEE